MSESIWVCCICSTKVNNPFVIKLTEDEKKHAQAMGGPVTDQYVYCRPCQRILGNREQGAQLIRGTLLNHLKIKGVADAEKIADKMYTQLISQKRLS